MLLGPPRESDPIIAEEFDIGGSACFGSAFFLAET